MSIDLNGAYINDIVYKCDSVYKKAHEIEDKYSYALRLLNEIVDNVSSIIKYYMPLFDGSRDCRAFVEMTNFIYDVFNLRYKLGQTILSINGMHERYAFIRNKSISECLEDIVTNDQHFIWRLDVEKDYNIVTKALENMYTVHNTIDNIYDTMVDILEAFKENEEA